MVARATSRYGARARRRSRGTVHSRGARREASAHEIDKRTRPYAKICQRGRERERYSPRCFGCSCAADASAAGVAWAGDAGSAVLARRRGRPSMLSSAAAPRRALSVHVDDDDVETGG